jgi:hypothetical protein
MWVNTLLGVILTPAIWGIPLFLLGLACLFFETLHDGFKASSVLTR